jgi:hypothetical protein
MRREEGAWTQKHTAGGCLMSIVVLYGGVGWGGVGWGGVGWGGVGWGGVGWGGVGWGGVGWGGVDEFWGCNCGPAQRIRKQEGVWGPAAGQVPEAGSM